jgi:predicted nuclease with RNAse H fold
VGAPVFGIDFSGDVAQWKQGRRNSNIWIASGEADGPRLRIHDLRPVQALEGDGTPFDRLVAFLSVAEGFAGIDAPFSVPKAHAANAAILWAEVAALRMGERPFGLGRDLVGLLTPDAGPNGAKEYRACEDAWVKQGLNVRSTLWNGPRGGAAFAVACMTLLNRHKGPVWPLRNWGEGALLVEAYPAAQLKTWGLSPNGYNGAAAKSKVARLKIIQALVADHGLRSSHDLVDLCAESADALDAVLCAYAAKAMAEGRHPRKLPTSARREGWVVVDDGAPPAAAQADWSSRLIGAAAEGKVRGAFDAIHEALAGGDAADGEG